LGEPSQLPSSSEAAPDVKCYCIDGVHTHPETSRHSIASRPRAHAPRLRAAARGHDA
jgi:hypothetical protein